MKEVKYGRPLAMQMVASQVAARASRADAEGDGPLEFKARDHQWHAVVGGHLNSTQAWLATGHGQELWGYRRGDVVWVRWGLGDGQEWVEAHDLRVGDKVYTPGEVPWLVEKLSDRPNTATPGTVWVVAEGDSEDGYYEKLQGSPAYYLAYVDEPVAVGWPRPAAE